MDIVNDIYTCRSLTDTRLQEYEFNEPELVASGLQCLKLVPVLACSAEFIWTMDTVASLKAVWRIRSSQSRSLTETSVYSLWMEPSLIYSSSSAF